MTVKEERLVRWVFVTVAVGVVLIPIGFVVEQSLIATLGLVLSLVGASLSNEYIKPHS
jgi:hypothetical protein